jgi:FtsZ-interacting cell division protein YlmF
VGIIKNTLIYLGFVEDDLQDEMATYEDPSGRRAPSRSQLQSYDESYDSYDTGAPEPRYQEPAHEERPLASVHQLPTRQVGQVHIVRPTSYGDAQQIGDRLRRSLPVIVNLEGAEDDLYRRVVAFASGLVYGLDGNIQKLAKRIYLVTPADMQVSTEDKRRLTEESSLGF